MIGVDNGYLDDHEAALSGTAWMRINSVARGVRRPQLSGSDQITKRRHGARRLTDLMANKIDSRVHPRQPNMS